MAGLEEASLRDYWKVLVRRRWIVLLATLTTFGSAMALVLMQDAVYESTAQMLLQDAAAGGLFDTTSQDTGSAERSIQNEIQVLEGAVVYQRLIDDLGLDAVPPEVRGESLAGTDSVLVTVRSGDAATSSILANAYVDAYINTKRSQSVEALLAAGKELQAKVTDLQTQLEDLDARIAVANDSDRLTLEAQQRVILDQQALFKQRLDQFQVDAALTGDSAVLVRPALVPGSPIEPRPVRTGLLGLAVGLLLGVGAAFLIDYLDDSIRLPADIDKVGLGIPVLAVVPVDSSGSLPVALSRDHESSVEAYRALRTNVQFLGLESSMQVIQVTSAMPGEGKTTTASNLAVVLAQSGNSVVLVDADLRRPRIHRIFGIDGLLGLTNNLAGESIDMTVHQYAPELAVIVSGVVPPNPSEMLSGKRMNGFVAELKARFDYVVIDSAPTLAVSDSVALSRHVDGVLMVVQAGRTSVPQLHRALATLEQVSAPVLGVVLNKAKVRRKNEYLYTYSQ